MHGVHDGARREVHGHGRCVRPALFLRQSRECALEGKQRKEDLMDEDKSLSDYMNDLLVAWQGFEDAVREAYSA